MDKKKTSPINIQMLETVNKIFESDYFKNLTLKEKTKVIESLSLN